MTRIIERVSIVGNTVVINFEKNNLPYVIEATDIDAKPVARTSPHVLYGHQYKGYERGKGFIVILAEHKSYTIHFYDPDRPASIIREFKHNA